MKSKVNSLKMKKSTLKLIWNYKHHWLEKTVNKLNKFGGLILPISKFITKLHLSKLWGNGRI